MTISQPQPLDDTHALDTFDSGNPQLDTWLAKRARQNHRNGASRCFVVCEGSIVVGFYALAAGAVTHTEVPGRIKRNMPDPIPAIVLGRLAVHKDWASQGIGSGLLKDAILRSLRMTADVGVRVMLCHAVDEKAKRFYLKHGFLTSPIDELTLMLPLVAPD